MIRIELRSYQLARDLRRPATPVQAILDVEYLEDVVERLEEARTRAMRERIVPYGYAAGFRVYVSFLAKMLSMTDHEIRPETAHLILHRRTTIEIPPQYRDGYVYFDERMPIDDVRALTSDSGVCRAAELRIRADDPAAVWKCEKCSKELNASWVRAWFQNPLIDGYCGADGGSCVPVPVL